ncbi:DUF4238 domain-containing protein [Terracidiphilus gabretensis]|uniref:DUF4238 domain-containing protein n=1 Tax=Terracidiphilus gabretensis TaxID=1577687 RepID=UPI0012F856E0
MASLSSEPDETFLLSDTPVITWNRLESGELAYGVGFHTTNVEVFLPISPATCLHILSNVDRTRRIASPTVTEINIAEASFAYNACFANQFSQELDVIVQQHISTVRIGENAFTVFHRNYENTIYDILMGNGR